MLDSQCFMQGGCLPTVKHKVYERSPLQKKTLRNPERICGTKDANISGVWLWLICTIAVVQLGLIQSVTTAYIQIQSSGLLNLPLRLLRSKVPQCMSCLNATDILKGYNVELSCTVCHYWEDLEGLSIARKWIKGKWALSEVE